MAKIEIIKAYTDWVNEPRNVETESDCVFDLSTGIYRFTGFLGHLCERDRETGPRYPLALAAIILGRRMYFHGRITVGYGAQQFTARMPVSQNVFFLCCALQAENRGELLDPRISTVRIEHGAPNTFVPTF